MGARIFIDSAAAPFQQDIILKEQNMYVGKWEIGMDSNWHGQIMMEKEKLAKCRAMKDYMYNYGNIHIKDNERGGARIM